MKILLAGGGTGGHVMPILAIVKQIRRIQPTVEFLWLGTKKGPEAKLASDNRIEFKAVLAGKMRRYFSFWNLVDMVKSPIGLMQAYFKVKKFRPDVCFSKGGYVSVPTVLACSKLKIPIILHESDIKPGQANLLMAKYATKIAVAYSDSKEHFKEYSNKIVVTGNPVREEVKLANYDQGMKNLKLNKEKPVLLVMGGSQGAQKINELVGKILDKLLEKWQVVHLVGPEHGNQILGNLGALENDYHVFNFLDGQKMGEALVSASLVISRAGANSLAELAILGKPAILIPYPHASADHQMINAKVFEKNKAAIILDEKNLTADILLSKINELFGNKEKLESMKLAMLTMANKNADNKLATEILNFASNKKKTSDKKIMIFTEGTILMHKNALSKTREEAVKQVENKELSVGDFANYLEIGKAAEKIKKWQDQGAEIVYLTSRKNSGEVEKIRQVLAKYNFPAGEIFHRKIMEEYKDVLEKVRPDILIEDDCESIGGQKEMAITFVNSEIKKKIKFICIKEFEGIDRLSDDVKLLA